MLDDLPLLGACVLRFINEDMVDAAVELVMHPGRGLILQKIGGLADEIVVIERAARALHFLVAPDHRASELVESASALQRLRRAAALGERNDPRELCEQALHRGFFVAHFFAAEAAERARRAFIGEKDRKIGFDRMRIAFIGGFQKLLAAPRGIAAERNQRLRDARPFAARKELARKNVCFDLCERIAGREAEPATDRFLCAREPVVF